MGDAPRQITALVVEPYAADQRLFDTVLRPVAERRLVANDVAAARRFLDMEAVDVAVVEPRGQGDDVWALLDTLASRKVPTVVVTSRPDPAVLDAARQHGAYGVMAKPFQPGELRRHLATMLDREVEPHHEPPQPQMSRTHDESSSKVPAGRHTEGDHHGYGRHQDRLAERTRSPDPYPGMSQSFSTSGGSAELHCSWSVLLAIRVRTLALSFSASPPFVTWLVLSVLATAASTWTTLNADRSADDPALPIRVALGVAVGPVAAPLALCAQGVVAGLATGAWTKAASSKTIMNSGIVAFEGFVLGVGLYAFMPSSDVPLGLGFVLAVVAATAIALVMNFASVYASLSYLAGRRPQMSRRWSDHLFDIGGGLVLALVVAGVEENWWVAAIAAAVAAAMVLLRRRSFLAAQVDAYATLQRHVREHERRHAALPDHTEQVVALVRRLVADRADADKERAVAGAWCHTLATGGWPDRCAGAPRPDLWDQVRHLPRSWDLTAIVEAAGRPQFIPLAGVEDLDISTVVGIACAVDALRLEGGRLNTTEDISNTWGHPKGAVDAAYDLHHS